MLTRVLLALTLFASISGVQLQAQGNAVLPGRMFVKLTEEGVRDHEAKAGGAFDRALQLLGGRVQGPLLPIEGRASDAARCANNAHTQRLERELARVLIVEFPMTIKVEEAVRTMASCEGVEYAEPWILAEPLGATVPDDSLYSQQAFLRTIHAEEAWGITSGGKDIVIAVADTEIRWDHPDLEPNMWTNPGESGQDGQGRDKRSNGVDDDGNGLVDDWRGWDFAGADNASPDNDTRSVTGGHGTAVAGLISAATNNRIGIASIGHSCSLLPMKIGPDAGGGLAFGLQAMDYASRMGARVFNTSWGSTGYSKTMEDMVNLVTSRGMLVVGGAGNNGAPISFYPASFPAVLSAGVTDAQDIIQSASNYGPDVDVMTPGQGALSTTIGGGYGGFGATSAAAPIAAGTAGLVVSAFPTMTPDQVRERIRVTCDNIDAVNPARVKYAGKGRVNAFRAVSDPEGPALRITRTDITDDNGDEEYEAGEDLRVSVEVQNILAATSGEVTMTLTPVTNASAVQITKGMVTLPVVGAGASAGNGLSPFIIRVVPGAVYDAKVVIRVDFMSDGYQDFDFFSITVNPSYRTIISQDLSLTVQANGTLGYLDYPGNDQGRGLQWGQQDAWLYMASLMIGTDKGHVVDAARGRDFLARKNDFAAVQPVEVGTPGEARSRLTFAFTDARADSARRLGIRVSGEALDYSHHGVPDVVFLRYRIHNTGTAILQGLRCALALDFGGYPQYYPGVVRFDSLRNAGYVTRSGLPVAGAFVIDPFPRSDPRRSNFWAINNDHSLAGNPFGTYDGFTDEEKWRSMSTFAGNRSAPSGNVGMVVTAQEATIAPGDSVTMIFGITAGNSSAALLTGVDAARTFWLSTNGADPVLPETSGPEILSLHPNPVLGKMNSSIHVTISGGGRIGSEILICDMLGRRVAEAVSVQREDRVRTIPLSIMNLPTGAYFCLVRTGPKLAITRFTVIE